MTRTIVAAAAQIVAAGFAGYSDLPLLDLGRLGRPFEDRLWSAAVGLPETASDLRAVVEEMRDLANRQGRPETAPDPDGLDLRGVDAALAELADEAGEAGECFWCCAGGDERHRELTARRAALVAAYRRREIDLREAFASLAPAV